MAKYEHVRQTFSNAKDRKTIDSFYVDRVVEISTLTNVTCLKNPTRYMLSQDSLRNHYF